MSWAEGQMDTNILCVRPLRTGMVLWRPHHALEYGMAGWPQQETPLGLRDQRCADRCTTESNPDLHPHSSCLISGAEELAAGPQWMFLTQMGGPLPASHEAVPSEQTVETAV
ncbi:hypothetical protein AAFF_G00395940 [Aldrovandia affinis]|uniref:Uncharacterized protein n=1 Tax=Aldrovandia affinis TaxID=143900 RepID=A0AAD7WKX3_9TELE|nr:hypothetical protein AAFF_G00395940 [Aldrovandia affinis]